MKILGCIRYGLILLFSFTFLFKIQAQHVYPKGKYHTINQLMFDSVQSNSACEVYVKSEGLYTQYIIYDSISGKKIAPVFAYFDGTDLFLNQGVYGSGKFYVKSLEKGRYYYFEDMYYSKAYMGAIVGGAVFGLVGAAIVYGVMNSSKKKSTIDFTDVPSEKLCGIVFDTQTGNIIGLSVENITRVFMSEPEIVSYFEESRKKIEDIRKCVQQFNDKHK
ncbi:MAG: hypothetical protein V4651_06505 [Bacteroidota bacterium]